MTKKGFPVASSGNEKPCFFYHSALIVPSNGNLLHNFIKLAKNKTAQPYWSSGFHLVAEIGLEPTTFGL